MVTIKEAVKFEGVHYTKGAKVSDKEIGERLVDAGYAVKDQIKPAKKAKK